IVLYAGSGGVYLSLNRASAPQLIKLDELNYILKKQKIEEVSGDISDDQKAILKTAKFLDSKKTFGEIIKIIIAENLWKQTSQPEKLIKPLYIKEPSISVPKTKIT
ncbi:MAG: hypothetical protein AAB953_02870, partial [Patescibacteria group bacterium]